MAEKFMYTVSPHLHEKGQTIERGMADVLIALTPAAIMAIIVFGFQAFYVMLVSCIVAALSELIMRAILRRPHSLRDMSAMVTGILFAFLLPPTTPLWVVAIGAFLAVVPFLRFGPARNEARLRRSDAPRLAGDGNQLHVLQ